MKVLGIVPLPSLPNLATLVGAVPAALNMAYWSKDAQASDFSVNFTLGGATVTSGVVSPSGIANAQKLVEDNSTGFHLVNAFDSAQMNTNGNIIYRVAVIAKAAQRTRIVVFAEYYTHEAAVSASVGYDLAGGNVGYDTAVGTQTTLDAFAMTSLGNGWWLCTLDFHYNGTPDAFSLVIQPKIFLDNGSGTAARSISYAGNGTSGVNLWWMNLLPVGAWSLTTQAFRDDFTTTATFDLANTLNPGFNWYINNSAPNSINPTWWSAGVLPPSLPGNFVISSPSILKMFDSTGTSGQWQDLFYSVGFPAAGGFVGQAWSPPMVFDGLFSWDNSVQHNGAFWAHAVEPMAGTIGPTAHWLEWDWVDSGATSSSIEDEYVSGGTPTVIPRSTNWIGNSMSLGDFHRLSGMWTTIASNGNSWGMFMSFFDGQFKIFSDAAYSSTINSPVIVDPNQVLLASFEALHMPIMVDFQNAGASHGPIFIDYMQVYTP